ncbi:hypothetical protein LguiB_016358 [Lonicera macranthoides]
MKTSLKKLRGLQGHRGRKQHSPPPPLQQQSTPHLVLDDLSLASQDMLDMRDCYESLISAAAATANSAFALLITSTAHRSSDNHWRSSDDHRGTSKDLTKASTTIAKAPTRNLTNQGHLFSEFSESLREMGECLLEKTAMNDDEESAKVLLMLGKVHFELQKFADRYRAHISQTISAPSESLLNELCIVEEMKRQCDEKRDEYENMRARHKEKGWLRSSKGETFSSQQVQAARDEYDEEATLFVFRMKSLKRGRSQSLLTQAARHHAAQLCFFRKAVKSLEAIEPHVKAVTTRQHIDYQFTGLDDDDDGDYDVDSDDDGDYETDSGDGCEVHDDGELSFADGQSDHEQEASKSRGSMEVRRVDQLAYWCELIVMHTAFFTLINMRTGTGFGEPYQCDESDDHTKKAGVLDCSLFSGEVRCSSKYAMLLVCITAARLESRTSQTVTPLSPQLLITKLNQVHGEKELHATLNSLSFHMMWKKLGFSRNLILDKVDLTFLKGAVVSAAKEKHLYRNPAGYSFGFGRELKTSSKSAPLFAEKNFDPAERFKQMRQSSTRKLQTYVLPTPIAEKGTNYSGSITQLPQSRTTHLKQGTPNLWHSSPLEHKAIEDSLANDKFSGPILTQSVLKRSNYNTSTTRQLTPPLTEGLSSLQHFSVNKKIKRQAFSGPLVGKSWPNNPIMSASSGPILSTGSPRQLFSGSLLHSPMPLSSSFQNLSSSASSNFVSSPKISELHELPRPPHHPHLSRRRPPSNLIRHSAPLLLPKPQQLLAATGKAVAVSNANASASTTLPLPPPNTIPRSYSIPSRDQGEVAVQASSKPLGAPQNLKMTEDIASLPLVPVTLSNS